MLNKSPTASRQEVSIDLATSPSDNKNNKTFRTSSGLGGITQTIESRLADDTASQCVVNPVQKTSVTGQVKSSTANIGSSGLMKCIGCGKVYGSRVELFNHRVHCVKYKEKTEQLKRHDLSVKKRSLATSSTSSRSNSLTEEEKLFQQQVGDQSQIKIVAAISKVSPVFHLLMMGGTFAKIIIS